MDKKIAIYIRISNEDKKGKAVSIENQRELLETYAKKYIGNNILEFIDNGYSGTNFERPAFKNLLEMIINNEISTILVKDFSRIGRNILDTGYYIEKVFPLHNIRFISVSDDFDSLKDSSVGELNYTFKYLMHEYYSRDLSNKIKSSKHIKIQQGTLLTKNCLYGYKRDGDTYIADDNTAVLGVIQLIFQLANDGYCINDIKKTLFDKKIMTPTEYKKSSIDKNDKNYDNSENTYIWSKTTIRRILKNERYIGTYIGGEYATNDFGVRHSEKNIRDKCVIIKDKFPPLIEKELFFTVQNIFKNQINKENTSKIPNDTKKSEINCFKGIIFCGYCGRRLTDNMNRKKDIFICRYADGIEEITCHKLTISKDILIEKLFKLMKKIATKIKNNNSKNKSLEDKNMIELLQHKQKLLFEKLIKEEISQDKYNEEDFILENEIGYLEKLIKNNENKHINYVEINDIVDDILKANEFKECFVNELVEKIEIFHNNKIKVTFKVKDFEKLN